MPSFRFALGAAVVLGVASGAALAAGDLSRQTPIEVTVDLGSPGKHEFAPKQLKFETGKLYKLILRNTSNDPHYFTSHAFSQMVFTRKVQVTQPQNGKTVTLAEFKGAIREIEAIRDNPPNGGWCRSRPAAPATCVATSRAVTARPTPNSA